MKKFILCFALMIGVAAQADTRGEAEYVYSGLSSGMNSWTDINTRNYFSVGADNQFMIEADYKNHFDESAGVLGANLTHVYNEDWYQDFSATYGSNTLVLAQLSLFTEIHRKVLPEKNLVLGLGAGWVKNAHPYQDIYALVDLNYYLNGMFSLQFIFRPNQSNPNAVTTFRYIGVLNFMYERKIEAFIRLETGNEGYSVISAGNLRNEFRSSSQTAQVRYWFTEKFGSYLYGELYQNPFYVRNSIGAGIMVNY